MKNVFIQLISLVLTIFFTVHPVSGKTVEVSTGGTVACPVTHDIRVSGTELRSASFHFYNIDEFSTITIDQISIFDGDGAVLYSETGTDLANDLTNGRVLGPHNGTRFDLANVFGTNTGLGGQDPLHLIMIWSADRKGRDLYAITQFRDRERNATTGAITDTRSRGMLDCAKVF